MDGADLLQTDEIALNREVRVNDIVKQCCVLAMHTDMLFIFTRTVEILTWIRLMSDFNVALNKTGRRQTCVCCNGIACDVN